MIRFVYLYVSLMITSSLSAQEQKANLDKLLFQYENSKPDKERVDILLLIDSIYLYRMPDIQNVLDSAMLMAQQAKDLSTRLKYQQGIDEATVRIQLTFLDKKDIQSAILLTQNATGKLKVRMLISLGERYLFRPAASGQDLDSAFIFIQQARNYSEADTSKIMHYQSLRLMGKYYFIRGQTTEGEACFRYVIDAYHRSGNKEREAFWWSELALFMPDTDKTYPQEINAYSRAIALYRELNMTKEQPFLMENMAYIQRRHNKLNLAEAQLLEAITVRKAIGSPKTYVGYSSLANLYYTEGNYQKALYYGQLAVKSVEAAGETYTAPLIYYKLADIYGALGESKKCVEWYQKALNNLGAAKEHYLFPICTQIVHALLRQDSAKAAFVFLNDFISKYEPVRIIDKEIVAACQADCLTALGKYDIAEKNYLQMIVLDEKEQRNTDKEIFGDDVTNMATGSEAYYTIARFYIKIKRPEIARPYLLKALSFQKEYVAPLSRQGDIQLLLFKADSLQGNYLSAIRHFEIHKNINDSIFNETTSKQIAELQIQYETERKEQDIKVLRSKEEVQAKELERTGEVRNYTLIMVVILMILILLGYNRYRIKQKSNRLLQAQQQEINKQNELLKQFLTAQQKLAEEKDWLLKEIHHRVKNNLQMIISLLNTQSEFLNNPSALDAIQESRERMQAIALIHQKLYQPDQSTSINMDSYIQEMVNYLSNSFSFAEKVRFKLMLEPVCLDVSQAVPLGLILNEAITNSLKYAFPGNRRGTITVTLNASIGNEIKLAVRDDGQGLPPDFDWSKNDSLGMQLIRLFAEQLDGDLQITGHNGVQVLLVFKKTVVIAGSHTNIKTL